MRISPHIAASLLLLLSSLRPLLGAEASPAELTNAYLKPFAGLGLPDAKGAEWVKVDSLEQLASLEELPTAGEKHSGNAWMLKPNPGGVAQLIVNQSRLIKVRVKSARKPSAADLSLPEVIVSPANLAHDLDLITGGLDAVRGMALHDGGEKPSDRPYRWQEAMAQTNLLLAHLAQQARWAEVRLVRAHLPLEPPLVEKGLHSSISQLAEARLQELGERWVQTGDKSIYARELDALSAKFGSQLSSADAIRSLSDRLKEPAPAADSRGSDRAADFLLSLEPTDASHLPLRRDWLFPEIYRDAAPAAPAVPGVGSKRIDDFFARRHEAVRDLLRVCGDRRLVHLIRSPARPFAEILNPNHDFYILERPEGYDEIPRPYELGELAQELLRPVQVYQYVAPGESLPEATIDAALAQLPQSAIAAAWKYLRASEPNREQYVTALIFLAREASAPKDVAALEGIFKNSNLWWLGPADRCAAAFQVFAQRRGAGQSALVDAVSISIGRGRRWKAEPPSYAPPRSAAERARDQGDSALLGQLLNSLYLQRFQPLLADLKAHEDDDRLGILLAALPKSFPAQNLTAPVLSALLQGAASLQSAPRRLALLYAIIGMSYREESELQILSKDAKALAALRLLVQDHRLVSPADSADTLAQDSEWLESVSEAAGTVAQLFWEPRLQPNQPSLLQKSLAAFIAWRDQGVAAFLAGKPFPPQPQSEPASQDELARLALSWQQLPPRKCLAAFRALPLDRQLAFTQALSDQAPWDPVFVQLQRTVVDLRVAEGASVDASPWLGRTVDGNFRDDLEKFLAREALAGRDYHVTLKAAHPLSGVILSILPTTRHLSLADYDWYAGPGLPPPRPDALQLWSVRFSPNGSRATRARVFYRGVPLWKDATLMEAWRREHGTLAPPDPSPWPQIDFSSKDPLFPTTPELYSRFLSALDEGDPVGIYKFTIQIATCRAAEPQPPDPPTKPNP